MGTTYEFPGSVKDIPNLPVDTDHIAPGWYRCSNGNYVCILDMPPRPNRKQRKASKAFKRSSKGRAGKTSKRLTKSERRAIVAARKQEQEAGNEE